jgi:hypothetical protein
MNDNKTIAQQLRKLVGLIEERDQSQQGDYSHDALDAQVSELWSKLEEAGLSTRAINQYVGAAQ